MQGTVLFIPPELKKSGQYFERGILIMGKMNKRVKDFETLIDEEVKKLLDELKNEHKTYGEVIEELDVNYGGASYNFVITKAKELFKKEISEISLRENR